MEQEEILFEGNHLRICRKGRWEYCQRTKAQGAVVIIALTETQHLLLVEQPRPALGRSIIELPAGLIGDEAGKEDSLSAAKAELFEETGYTATHFYSLAYGPLSPGMSSETAEFVFAKGLKKQGDGGGIDAEDIMVHEVPIQHAESWIQQKQQTGQMIDPKVYVGLYFAQQQINLQNKNLCT